MIHKIYTGEQDTGHSSRGYYVDIATELGLEVPASKEEVPWFGYSLSPKGSSSLFPQLRVYPSATRIISPMNGFIWKLLCLKNPVIATQKRLIQSVLGQ